MVRHHHIEEAAGAEGRNREPNGSEAQAKALVQVGADKSSLRVIARGAYQLTVSLLIY